jgi:hypothetical protein
MGENGDGDPGMPRYATALVLLFLSSALVCAATPVPWEKLAAYLPAMLDDMPRYKNPASGGLGSDWSMASVKYGQGGRGGIVRIFHYAKKAVSGIPPIRALRKAARDNEAMVIRAESVGAYETLLTYDRKARRSAAKVIVTDEILVVVEINNTPSFDAALGAAKGINLAGLAALVR